MNMCDVKSMSDDNKSVQRSMNKDDPPNSVIQIIQNSIADDCKSLSTSSNEHNNQHQFLATEETKAKESKRFEETKMEDNKEFEVTTSDDFNERKSINAEEEACSEKKIHMVAFETTEELPKKSAESKGRNRAFSLIDTLISLSVVGPMVVGFWRGIWTWMDLHAELFPAWFCMLFGVVLHVMFTFFKNRLHDTYMNKWTKLSTLKRLPYCALRTLYTYIFGVACNAHWRGSWIIIDDYFFMHIWITTCILCLLLACLATLRCIRNLIAPPLIIYIDTPTHLFKFPTRYNVSLEESQSCVCAIIAELRRDFDAKIMAMKIIEMEPQIGKRDFHI